MFEESVGLIDFFLSMPELIILLMFSSLMCLMLTGQRVFGIMGFVGIAFALIFIDRGSLGYGFNAAIKLFNWYPMLTLPMFVFMGFMLSESGIANDMYHMFHVWFGGLRGGLAVGTLLVMIMISCMNGLSVAGMAIGCSVALPELLKRNSADCQKFLTDYTVNTAQSMLARWKELGEYLIVKFNDMAVKPEENGAFKRTKTGLGAPVQRPGYPEDYARKMIELTGDKYRVK